MPGVWEVEQKYIVAQSDQIVKRLIEIGAVESHTEHHIDTYLAHPCRNLRVTDEAFRLRRLDGQACVTYKGPRIADTVKMRPEIELKIDAGEAEQWLKMLAALGFRPLPSVRKTRRRFLIAQSGRSYNVMLDQVEELGNFVEIEVLVSSQEELSKAGAQIESLGSSLGLNQVQPKSYLSLLLAKLGLE